MLIETLKKLYNRDIQKLRTEIESYKNEKNIWYIEKNIANSGGNLCLHLVGNLKTYIGKELGGTPYVRNRDLEFSSKDVPRAELLKMIDETIAAVNKAFDTLKEEDLPKEYPAKVFDYSMTIEYFLVFLSMHLGYHLGQVNYHRRLLDEA